MIVRFYAGPRDGDTQNVPDDVHTITIDVYVGPRYSPTGETRMEHHTYTRINNPKNVGPEVIFRHHGFDTATPV